MIRLTEAVEEFASRRRAAQDDIEKALRASVARALDITQDTSGWSEVMEEVVEQYRDAYADEAGSPALMPVKDRDAIEDVLKEAHRSEQPDKASVDRVTTWLATTILSLSTMAATLADEEELFLEWVDMHDKNVRKAHRDAGGQVRPVGEKFDVGGHKMIRPGDPTVPTELWIGCRCTLRPVPAKSMVAAGHCAPSETTYAADDTDEAEPLDEPTHAGMAVYAADTQRILMIQRSMDQDDPPEVRGTWEFPGGTIEEGEDAQSAAWREFSEETGLPQPDGEITNGWRSANGIYQGFVCTVPVETEAFTEINPDADAAEMVNPDDPERRTPDVSAWFTVEQIKGLGTALRPEVHDTDWSVFGQGDDDMAKPKTPEELRAEGMSWADIAKQSFAPFPPKKDDDEDPPVDEEEKPPPTDGDTPPEPEEDEDEKAKRPFADTVIPFHSVLAVEGKKTGDGRRFMEGSLSHRPLPLPYTWQKIADEHHNGNVVVAKIEKIKMGKVVDEQTGEMLSAQFGSGHFIQAPEADEFIGLLAQFGRFGTSIDADSVAMELNEEEETADFTEARTSSACAVAIPALAEAWIAIGEPPEEWGMDEPEEEAVPESLVASFTMNEAAMEALLVSLTDEFKDLAPGKTEDGPGWLTHPVDTDRLRDYWVSGPGAAKIGWGTPGDFNRCRLAVAEYVKPQHLAGYCANRHYDALGFWPGRPVSGETMPFAADTLQITDRTPAPSLTLVASGAPAIKAPAGWFDNPEFQLDDPRMVEFEHGKHAVPFTITEEGQVYGHIAARGTCHMNVSLGHCVEPPFSETDYAYFRTGAVLLDNGEMANTGVISIGGGHAGQHLNARQALAHYDSTSTAGCDVAMYDDEFGIAVAGWVRPGTSPEMVAALRASKVSGDWRPWGPHALELIAALAVNVPGFGVPRVRIAAGLEGQASLVAAGMFASTPEQVEANAAVDTEALAYAIAVEMAGIAHRREQIAALATSGVQ